MEVVNELKKLGAKRVFIQFPEGLKTKIQYISNKLKNEGFDIVLSLEPCYGACDILDVESKRLDCDVILHIGHSDFGVKSDVPVVYWDYFIDVNPLPILEKEIKKLKEFKNIGLITTLQFVKAMKKVKDFLEKKGKIVHTHKSLKYPGQVLGCYFEAAKKIEDEVDCFLFVGAGEFHPLGVSIEVEKPVFSLDLEKKEIYSLEKEKKKWLKRKAWHEAELEDAKRVGIIVCWKKGQNKIDEAMKMKKRLEDEGKDVYLFAFDRVTEDKLEGMEFDCLINLACPRLEDELLFWLRGKERGRVS